jgi:hypothetical protein
MSVNIFQISWEDLRAYDKCPRKLAVDTRRASLRGLYLYPTRHLNAEDLLGGADTVPESFALRNLEGENAVPMATVTRERLEDYAKYCVQQLVRPTKRVTEAIARKYGDIHTIGRVEVRQPDMICRPRPDFYVLTSSGKRVIVEMKSKPSDKQRFKAKFYNGLTESNGVFIVGAR